MTQSNPAPIFLLSAILWTAWAIASGPKAQALEWHDGDRTLKLFHQKALVAEFSQQPALSRSVPARSIKQQGNARILNLGSETRATQSLVKARGAADSASTYSEVFADEREGGRLRALPGDIIVQFEDTLSEADIEKFAKSKELKLLRKLEFQANTYLIASPPGMASLELANQLYEEEGVRQSSPNWWVETSAR